MHGHQNSALASYLDWWTDAGLAEAVQDVPCRWLQPPNAVPSPANDPESPQIPNIRADHRQPVAVATTPATPPTSLIGPMPNDLPTFDAWIASHPDLPGSHWSPQRVTPVGPAAAPIIVIADMPDPDDLRAGQLLSGTVGNLFDAMMEAIGHQRQDLRIASIAYTRPAGGRWDDASATALRAIALHHIHIAKAQRVLLLGQLTCQLLTGDDVPADGDGLRNINHYGVTTAVTAIHHPRLLLTRTALKRGAWTALKSLREPA